ncbi:MAG: membrane associated rhomboid family serine protease [Flavobacteriales bacterium]|jgi:membrane associated rhomboid family serine protease
MNTYRPNKFSFLPEIVKNLLIINGLFFVATYVLESTYGVDLIKYLGLYQIGSGQFQPYQIITHMFMHGNFQHVALNMFALWMFGNSLENIWGGKRFLIYYLLTGLGAALIHLTYTWWDLSQLQSEIDVLANNANPETYRAFLDKNVPSELSNYNNLYELVNQWTYQPNNTSYAQKALQVANEFLDLKTSTPTVGASGAVFGVLLAFGMLFPNTRIYLYFAIPIKAKYFVMLYGALELYSGISANPADNVAHFAHLGGMLIGFLLIRFWNKKSQHMY